jgi:hypothetical protein
VPLEDGNERFRVGKRTADHVGIRRLGSHTPFLPARPPKVHDSIVANATQWPTGLNRPTLPKRRSLSHANYAAVCTPGPSAAPTELAVVEAGHLSRHRKGRAQASKKA